VGTWSWLNSLKIETKMASFKDYFSQINRSGTGHGFFVVDSALGSEYQLYNLFGLSASKGILDIYAVDSEITEEEFLYLKLSHPDRTFVSNKVMLENLESILDDCR
jgi:hypothetical protein